MQNMTLIIIINMLPYTWVNKFILYVQKTHWFAFQPAGLSKEEAKIAYIDLVADLKEKFGFPDIM